MRQGSSSRRSRSRGNGGKRNNQPRSQVFDSNGPDVRIRGTAFQVHEKYMALAKDAASAGDHILAESYLQHAEHYQRIINSWNDNSSGDNKADNAYSTESEETGYALPASMIERGSQPANKENSSAAEEMAGA